jgi:16S rRNA (adenine(1408)-N(1))-methyltransferase
VAAAEALPAELTGVADLVTVYFPWASLLRGLVTADGPVLSYAAALCRPGGTFEAMWSLVDRDRSVADIAQDDAIAARFAGAGLRVLELRAPTQAEIDATCSTWAKRLRAGVDRPVTMVRSVRV